MVEEVEPDILEGVSSRPAEVIELGHRVYRVQGGNWGGFIVAGSVLLYEDAGEFFEPGLRGV